MSIESSYFQNAQNYFGEIPTYYAYVLRLKDNVGFGEVVESLFPPGKMYIETDYAGLHALDPNWYEDGKYRTGILDARLYTQIEEYAREKELLDNEMRLCAECYFSEEKQRPLYIGVVGGERDDWGQFLALCSLESLSKLFEPVVDRAYINIFRNEAEKVLREGISETLST